MGSSLEGTGWRLQYTEYLRDVGSPARHALAERDLAAGLVRSSIERICGRDIFDCDGVLNDEPGLHGAVTPDDVKLIPGAGDAVRRARRSLGSPSAFEPTASCQGNGDVRGAGPRSGRLEALLTADAGVLDESISVRITATRLSR